MKNAKVTKSDPKTDQGGGTKIDLVTLFVAELPAWRRQGAQMCALADPRCKKGAQWAPEASKSRSKTQKNMENDAQKVPQKDPALKIGAQDYATQRRHDITS